MEVAAYVRVSTPEQSLERQLESTHSYAQDRLGAAPGSIETYRDKATGTNTNREHFREMLGDVEGGQFDAVVVHSISRMSRSIRDLDQTVERIVEDGGAEMHVISESITLTGNDDPYQRAMLQLLGVFAELEAEMTRQRVKEGIRTRQENEEYHHGPAPLGFKKNDGTLIEAAEFDRVRTVLEKVSDGSLSKRKAARELDTSRRTIGRALDRAELYGLD